MATCDIQVVVLNGDQADDPLDVRQSSGAMFPVGAERPVDQLCSRDRRDGEFVCLVDEVLEGSAAVVRRQ